MMKKTLLSVFALFFMGGVSMMGATEDPNYPGVWYEWIEGSNYAVTFDKNTVSGDVVIAERVTITPDAGDPWYIYPTKIADNASMWGNTTMTSLTIEAPITSIPNSVFGECSALTSVTLPVTLTSIGDYAFQKCDALTSIILKSTAVSLGENALEGNSAWNYIAQHCVVTIPEGTTSNYTTDSWTMWDEFYSNHNLREAGSFTIGTDGYTTYYNTYGYVMPAGVEGYLIEWAYNGCAHLVKVYDAGDEVVEGIALLLKSTETLDADKTFTFSVFSSGGNTASWPTDDSSNSYANKLGGTQTVQTIIPWDESSYYYYKLAKGSKGLGWYWGAADGGVFTNAAHKAYLCLSQTTEARGFVSLFDDETTGVVDVRNKTEEASGTYFDLRGRRVDQPTKGLYIVNGKKVVIK